MPAKVSIEPKSLAEFVEACRQFAAGMKITMRDAVLEQPETTTNVEPPLDWDEVPAAGPPAPEAPAPEAPVEPAGGPPLITTREVLLRAALGALHQPLGGQHALGLAPQRPAPRRRRRPRPPARWAASLEFTS